MMNVEMKKKRRRIISWPNLKYYRAICVVISAQNRVSLSILMSIESRTRQYRVTTLSGADSDGRDPHNFSTGNTNACGSRPACSRQVALLVNDCAMRNVSISSPLHTRGSSSIAFIFRRAAVYLQLVNPNERRS